MPQMTMPQCDGHFGQTHGRSGVSRVRLLHRVHRERTNGIGHFDRGRFGGDRFTHNARYRLSATQTLNFTVIPLTCRTQLAAPLSPLCPDPVFSSIPPSPPVPASPYPKPLPITPSGCYGCRPVPTSSFSMATGAAGPQHLPLKASALMPSLWNTTPLR